MKRIILTTAAALTLAASALSAATLETVDTDSGAVIAAANSGLTLYTFRKDVTGLSNCYDDCAAAWPPFIASPSAKADGDLTIIERRDGTLQWALAGQPLYFWAGDAERGDVTGDGVGGVWDAVRK